MQVFDVPFDQPPRWKVWCARLFGRRAVTADSGVRITGYHWRGALYIVGYERLMKGRP